MRILRLKLSVVSDDKKIVYSRINQVSNDTYKAYNAVISSQHFNDRVIHYLKSRNSAVENYDARSVFKDMFGTLEQASAERDLKSLFENLPPCVTNPLTQLASSAYNNDKKEVFTGTRSIRSYKRGTPIPTTAASIRFHTDGSDDYVVWSLSRSEKITFKIFYGKDRGNYKATIKKILSQELKFSAPSIQKKNSDLYILLPVKDTFNTIALDDTIVVGVDLGLSIPAYVSLNIGSAREAISSKEDFLRVRTQLQHQKRRISASVASSRGGHGRKKKLSALDRINDRERAYIQERNHFISKRVVDFAIKNNAKTINLEFLKGFSKDTPNSFVLRNWSYFELQTMIQTKAKRYEIDVKFVDPYRTSQTCNVCGVYHPDNRVSQSDFVCQSCGVSMNADYNASRNIAKSTIYVSKQEDCQFYKRFAIADGGVDE